MRGLQGSRSWSPWACIRAKCDSAIVAQNRGYVHECAHGGDVIARVARAAWDMLAEVRFTKIAPVRYQRNCSHNTESRLGANESRSYRQGVRSPSVSLGSVGTYNSSVIRPRLGETLVPSIGSVRHRQQLT
jgi:hypothetical protein